MTARTIPTRSPAVAFVRGALLCAGLAWSSSAHAGDAAILVTRDGPPSDPSCPDTYTLRERVRSLRSAGLAYGSGDAAPRLVVTFVRQPDATFQALVRAGAPIEGERTLSDRGKGCASLGEAVAVTVALLLDGTSDGTGEAPSPTMRIVPGVRFAPRPTAQLFVSGGVLVGTVAAPAAKLAGEIALQPRWISPRIALELGAGFALVPSVEAPLGPGAVSTGATYGTARLGVRIRGSGAVGTLASRFAIVPSLAFSAGSVRAQGTGFEQDGATSRAFARTGLALPLVWELGHGVSARLSPEVDVGFRTQRFVVSNLEGAVTLPRLGTSLSLGVGLALF